MTTIQSQTVKELADDLKDTLIPPTWSGMVKTGHGQERPPQDEDWWYTRGASILLKVKNLGPIGVNKLSTKYGTKKNRGNQPEKFVRAGRNHIRKILQQLEEAELVEHGERENHKGRILTKKGQEKITAARKKARSDS